jgi:hypothetical protein
MAGGLTFSAIGFAMFANIDATTGFASFTLGSFTFSVGNGSGVHVDHGPDH